MSECPICNHLHAYNGKCIDRINELLASQSAEIAQLKSQLSDARGENERLRSDLIETNEVLFSNTNKCSERFADKDKEIEELRAENTAFRSYIMEMVTPEKYTLALLEDIMIKHKPCVSFGTKDNPQALNHNEKENV